MVIILRYIYFFDIAIPMYTVAICIGAILVFIGAVMFAKRERIEFFSVFVMLIVILVGTIAGANIFAVLIHIISPLAISGVEVSPSSIITTLFSTQVLYGGMYGGILSFYIYLKIKKHDVKYYMWFMTPLFPLFFMFCRAGCFLGGCCYGAACTVPDSFAPLLMGSGGITRVPTQLIELCAQLLLFIIFLHLHRKRIFKNNLLSLYLVCYAVVRFVLEFWRDPKTLGPIFFGLSTSQIVALITIVIIAVRFIRNRVSAMR